VSETGTFLVTEADDASAVLADVADGQVHTLSTNPGLSAGEAIEATIEPEPPMGVTWSVVEIDARWGIAVEVLDEPPSPQDREAAAGLDAGEVARADPGADAARHVIAVPPGETDAAAEDVRDDEATRRRAARLGAARVEIRAADGVVGVAYV